MSAASAHSRLLRLQHRIYRALEREAEAIYGRTPASIRRYERRCREDFRGRYRMSTKAELIAAIRGAQVSFVGDFHSFAQSQRTALRLMREAILPGERWALGLELIPSQYQDALDAFQAGRLSVGRFHALIRYQEEWGFPWKNYEPLFRWAREHGVRLVALNRPKALLYRGFARRAESNGRDLTARDQWAAGILTDLLHDDPSLRVLALYGGLHVGTRHLPAELARISGTFLGEPLRSVTIHQNDAGLYWKLARQERELHAQVLRFRPGVFCVFSGTPWAQLQSLIGGAEGEDLEDGSGADADEIDYLSLMSGYGAVIAEFLGLEAGPFESLSARSIDEADFVDSLQGALAPGELDLVRRLIADNHRFYLPREQIAYLASPSQNAAAELAAVHLLSRRRGARAPLFEAGREGFFRHALEAAFGFLGRLILNPRRKCDLPPDHVRRLRQLARGEKQAFAREAQARRLAVAVLAGGGRRERALSLLARGKPRGASAACTLVAARMAGQVLAKRIHPVLLKARHGSKGFERIVGLLTRGEDFEAAYRELTALTSKRQASKRDAF